MTHEQTPNVDPRWDRHEADDWSDAIVQAMALGGIERLYFVSGSEIGFYQESIAKAREREWPSPRLVTVTHEGVALNAAIGDAMVTGRPAATAVHVDAGTLNYGGGVHTAWRGGFPVLMTAGGPPRALMGTMRGSRTAGSQIYHQESRDQAGIVRDYVKMDHRLEHQDNPGMMVSRLLQLMMSDPRGPAYLVLPPETARLRFPDAVTHFPTLDQLGVARAAWPDPADAKRVAEWLIKADNPCIYPARSGRDHDSVAELVRLAELLALPVDTEGWDHLNFPMTHPLCGTGPAPHDADVLLVIESPAPFSGAHAAPKRDAKIAWVDVDPVQSRFRTMDFGADLWLPVSVTGAARAIYEAATSMLTKSDMDRIADRRARLEERKRELAAAAEARAQEARKRTLLDPYWVAYQLAQVLEPDAILLDDTITSSRFLRDHHARSQPGTYFRSGGSSGGWGVGAAFGAKMAKPDRDVVLASGDGYFTFGSPLSALWSAAYHKAAFLSVVFVNKSYVTGTTSLMRQYPDGAVTRSGDFEGGLFDPPPDFAKLAESANGYGERVTEPEEVGPALRRGLGHVRNGTPALIAVDLPTLLEEAQLAGGGRGS